LYLSAVTVADLRSGIAAMPDGKRRQILHERVEGELLPVFAGRVLPFDLDASRAYAELMANARAAGQSINMADAYIAAIAAARGFCCGLKGRCAVSGCWRFHHQPMGGGELRLGWTGAAIFWNGRVREMKVVGCKRALRPPAH